MVEGVTVKALLAPGPEPDSPSMKRAVLLPAVAIAGLADAGSRSKTATMTPVNRHIVADTASLAVVLVPTLRVWAPKAPKSSIGVAEA